MWRRKCTFAILNACPTYIVSPDSKDENTLFRNRIVKSNLEERGFYDVAFVKGVYLPRDPIIGCSMSHAVAMQQALHRQAPFLLLENDAIPETIAPLNLDVPPDADAVYVGTSVCAAALGATKHIHHTGGNFYSETPFNPKLVRIWNMLSTHAVLICSERFARNWQLCAVEAATRNVPIDTMIARTQRFFNVYAEKKPQFYQSETLGGQEKYTRKPFTGTLIESAAELPQQHSSFIPPCITADLASL